MPQGLKFSASEETVVTWIIKNDDYYTSDANSPSHLIYPEPQELIAYLDSKSLSIYLLSVYYALSYQ